MHIENRRRLSDLVDSVLAHESRLNEGKSVRYWYPLSMATYGTEEIVEALDSMCSFRTSMAEKTLQFERLFAQRSGAADAVMVNSGSSADLLLCLLLTNPLQPTLKPGDEVLVPAVTWPTQIWSALMAGLRVKLVDVDPKTLNVDCASLEASITAQTRAVFLVHLMGNPCHMGQVQALAAKHGLYILEDCCEALDARWNGSHVGTFGVGGSFSFFFSHHITTMEGGMVSVPDVESAEQLRLLRAHGWIRNAESARHMLAGFPDIDSRYAFVNWGLNVRPTEVQASFGMRQLEKADAFGAARQRFANLFRHFANGTEGLLSMPTVEEEAEPCWLALPLMVAADAPFTRDQLTAYLERHGVETRPIVAGNLARQPVAGRFPGLQGRYPGADIVHDRGFYIGLSPLQTDEGMSRLIDLFDGFIRRA